ncbi:MAG: protein kinase [Polyangiaceae bacterium]|nr:protein kinase [Polyangiaceae bacterium]
MTQHPRRWQALELGDDLVLGGRFAVERIVHVGASTLVLVARQASGSPCAITVLRPELGPTGPHADCFVAQAERLAKVASDHVVGVLEVSRLPSGLPFAVSEELPTPSLRDQLVLRGPLSLAHAVSHLGAVCDGLAAAHAHGAVHGQLGPERILLGQRGDGTAQLKLSDFGLGLARLAPLAPGAEDDGPERALTARHLAPEQLSFAVAADVRCDVWGIGVLLHELCLGTSPFAAATFEAVAAKVKGVEPARLRTVRADVPAALEELVAECLDKQPERRPQRVALIGARLRKIGFEVDRAPRRPSPASVRAVAPVPAPETVRSGGAARREPPPAGERVILSRVPVVPVRASAAADEAAREHAPRPAASPGLLPPASGPWLDRPGPAELRELDPGSSGVPEPGERTGERVFGRYVLERRLAVSRAAEVFLARPREGRAPAPALVVKRPWGHAEFDLERLRLEVVRSQVAPHPHLATIYELGLVDAVPYLAMELVDGVDCRRLMRHAEELGRRLPVEVAVYIARRVADGLAAMHTATDQRGVPLGLVHGAVAPSSVYLSSDGEVKLANRSLALRSHEIGERAGAGKFDYQSPEELADEPVDHRADLFALGVLLAEMLIGERLFPGKGVDVLSAIQSAHIEPLTRAAASLPAGLYEVCARALARRPVDRYPSATDLERALARLEPRDGESALPALCDWVRGARDAEPVEAPTSRASLAPPERTATLSLHEEVEHARSHPPRSEPPSTLRLRLAAGGVVSEVTYADLVERIATGVLGADDETTYDSASFRPIGVVPQLARHLRSLPEASTEGLERVFPEHTYALGKSSMLQVLGEMRQAAATALLLAETGGGDVRRRKEIYLRNGRLHSATSSERDELLGECLVRLGKIDRAELDLALAVLPSFDGRIGDALIGLGLVEARDVFRAIRDQGRDRLAALFAWRDGKVCVYLGRRPKSAPFDLDLDLSFPMVAGALIESGHEPEALLPARGTSVERGARLPGADAEELRAVHPAVRVVAEHICEGLFLGDLLVRSERAGLSHGDACAAVATARALRWVSWRDHSPNGRV